MLCNGCFHRRYKVRAHGREDVREAVTNAGGATRRIAPEAHKGFSKSLSLSAFQIIKCASAISLLWSSRGEEKQ